jgi:hypothetical protein
MKEDVYILLEILSLVSDYFEDDPDSDEEIEDYDYQIKKR